MVSPRQDMSGRVHLGPQEPGELSGYRGGNDAHAVLVLGQVTEPAMQPELRLPCPGDGASSDALLAFGDHTAGKGTVPVLPGSFDELGADMGVAGLGEMPAVRRSATGVLRRDQAAKPMNADAFANRRQSHTSAARPSPPSASRPCTRRAGGPRRRTGPGRTMAPGQLPPRRVARPAS